MGVSVPVVRRPLLLLALMLGAVSGGCLMGEMPVTSTTLPICKEWEGKAACCNADSLRELASNWAGQVGGHTGARPASGAAVRQRHPA